MSKSKEPKYHLKSEEELKQEWQLWYEEAKKNPVFIPEQPMVIKDGKMKLFTDKGDEVVFTVKIGIE